MGARLLMARMRKCLVSLPLFKPPPSGYLFSSSPFLDSCKASSLEHEKVSLFSPLEASRATGSNFRAFCSRPLNLDNAQGPAAIDYRSVLPEDEFHRLADETIHDLQEKIEEYGDCVQLDGFDIDYGSEVLTLKLGSLGTYVLNKQTPNRQIWLSSPVRMFSQLRSIIDDDRSPSEGLNLSQDLSRQSSAPESWCAHRLFGVTDSKYRFVFTCGGPTSI